MDERASIVRGRAVKWQDCSEGHVATTLNLISSSAGPPFTLSLQVEGEWLHNASPVPPPPPGGVALVGVASTGT